MSASPTARQVTQSIPVRKVMLNDPSQLPNDYSTTPGGTLYSTTPGGTRVVYERNFLLQLRNSPLSRTPPSNLSKLPNNVLKAKDVGPNNVLKTRDVGNHHLSPAKEKGSVSPNELLKDCLIQKEDSEQFEMDM